MLVRRFRSDQATDPANEEHVRVTTAFNKMLSIPGATVASVEFNDEGMVVGIRRRAARPVCPCGWTAKGAYDSSRRRWRHLDLGASRLLLEADIRRLHCRRCDRVVTERVPWARPRARHTRDFEDVVAWLAQRCDKTTISRLLRTSWETVAGIVERVVAEQIDVRRLTGLLRIGVDEVSYRKGHRYLTVVADHDQAGKVVWAAEGKNAATLEQFYDELGEAGCQQLQAVSMDLGAAFKKATDTKAPQARQCVDPFHLVALANEAINKGRRWAWNVERGQGQEHAPTRPRATSTRRPAAAEPGALGQAHPLGTAEGPRPSEALPTRSASRAASQQLRALPLLAAQGRAPRPLPARRPTRRINAPGLVARLGLPQPDFPPSSHWPRPYAQTATASWQPSNWGFRTANSKGSTARSGSSTTVATAITAPPPSSP